MPTLVTESPCPARISFGRRLRHWRRHAGLTQAELGRKMAYDHSFISRVERGSRWPTRELAHRCDELLGASGELVDLWRQANLERQSAHRPVSADPATVAGLANLLADEAPANAPMTQHAHQPEPEPPPAQLHVADHGDGADDETADGHLRQVVRWLEHAPGPVLRRLATLVSARPETTTP